MDKEHGGFEFLDTISILSFIIGLQNLELNKQQVDSLSREMTDNQDTMLKTIIQQNEEIIKLLKESKNAHKKNDE